jgi:hypothetical protein
MQQIVSTDGEHQRLTVVGVVEWAPEQGFDALESVVQRSPLNEERLGCSRLVSITRQVRAQGR